MEPGFTLRKIEQKDNQAVAQLIRSILEEYGVNQPGTVYTDPTTNHLYELFSVNKSHYWVVEHEEEIIGVGGVYPTEGLPQSHIELVKLYVSSKQRGKGIGKALIEKCFDQALKDGFDFMYLESLPELKEAVSLYYKMGFYDLTKRLGDSGHFACSILMEKKLKI